VKNATSEIIREMLSANGPCLSLVSRTGPELTNTLNELRRSQKFGAAGEQLFDGIEQEIARIPNAAAKSCVAVFRSAQQTIVWPVGDDCAPVALIADRFDARSVIAAGCAQKTFYILALSQNRTRLLECTRASSVEVPLPQDIPTSYADSRQTRKPDHVLDNRASGGPSMGSAGVMFGTSTDREDKDEMMLQFFCELDRGVHNVLRNSDSPLVIVGVEHELALYRRVNTYPHLVEPGVHGAPDGLEGGEMHRRALDLLREHPADPVIKALNDFDKKVGTGHGSSHIQEVVAAAYQGRVSHLYLQSGAHYLGSYDPVRQRVKHSEDPLDGATDLVNAAIEQTLAHSGEVRVVPSSLMPNGVPVCALFRYPTPQSTSRAGAEVTSSEAA
jgi:hypothetical protein